MQPLEFKVPLVKGDSFYIEWFNFLGEAIHKIASQTEKWPDNITFFGTMGKELLDIIEEKEWDFKRFNLTHENTTQNKIRIEYTKPLKQTEERGAIKGDSLHGQTMEGYPGDKTIGKIKDHAMSASIKIERNIRPVLEVMLSR